ncbi:MAG: hypothetical protein D6788_11370 [Planctomycetota bacterium]|nr:MAG: hypothetical protein D6788_11370 [Planctomycetota bacterium]
MSTLFNVPFDDIATGTSDGVYKTIAAIINPDTAGARFLLREIDIYPNDDAPPDTQVRIAVKRILDVSAGTAGTAGTTIAGTAIPKLDPNSIDASQTAKLDYSVEPTTYETNAVFQAAMNSRGGFQKPFDDETAVRVLRDQHLGLLAAPNGSTQVRLSGSLLFELF